MRFDPLYNELLSELANPKTVLIALKKAGWTFEQLVEAIQEGCCEAPQDDQKGLDR